MSGLLRRDDLMPRYTLFPREIFRRDEEDRRRRCRWHRRGGLTKYPAEKIRGTAGVVRELCGLARPECETQGALDEPARAGLAGDPGDPPLLLEELLPLLHVLPPAGEVGVVVRGAGD